MAWITQGPIADRSIEMLGSTDRGITVYRNMLLRELKKVEHGEDPMNVFRDANDPQDHGPATGTRSHAGRAAASVEGMRNMFVRHEARYCPLGPEIIDVFARPRREPAAV